jgi:hypothetical protein
VIVSTPEYMVAFADPAAFASLPGFISYNVVPAGSRRRSRVDHVAADLRDGACFAVGFKRRGADRNEPYAAYRAFYRTWAFRCSRRFGLDWAGQV